MGQVDEYFEAADTVVDLSADFRLPEAALYDEVVRRAHVARVLGARGVRAPEINRENLSGADLIAGGGVTRPRRCSGSSPSSTRARSVPTPVRSSST